MHLPRIAHTSLAAKLLATGALVGTVASIAGLGTFATFTSSTTASQTAASGTVNIALGAAGTAANRLTIGATDLVAGDTVERAVNLVDGGSANLASIKLTTAATTSSLLDTDTTNGLQMQVDRCSTAWTEAGTAPAYTYTCSGTTTSVIASRAVVGSALTLTGSPALTAGATDNLRVKLTLPASADNTFQGKTSTIGYTFDAIQRTATSR